MIQTDALSLRSQRLLEQIIAEELNEQPLFGSSWIQQNNPNLSIDVRLAKTIAQQIYDSKGLIKDDLNATLRAIKRIKDSKQFELVQTELRKMTDGRGIGRYISEFLGTMLMGVEINMIETLETGRAIVKHLKQIKADPKTIDIINNRIAQSSLQKSLIDTGWGKDTPGGMAVDALNSASTWLYEHDTWDRFFNGPDGIRDLVYYNWVGVGVTTALSFLGPLKAIPIALFGLLLVDDIKRMSEQGVSGDILLDMLFDAMGVFVGGVGGKVGQASKTAYLWLAEILGPIFQKLLRGGRIVKIIKELIIRLKPFASKLAKSKLGQIIITIGNKLGNLISKITKLVSTGVKTLIKIFSDLAIKLKGTRFYKHCIAIIKMLRSVSKWIITAYVDAIKWIFKTIWAILSFPGKSIAWILEKIGFKGASQAGKVVFNVTISAYIMQNYPKWIDEWKQKNGVYERNEMLSLMYDSGDLYSFKQRDITHVAKSTNGEYFKLPVLPNNDIFIFEILEQQKKWTKINLLDQNYTIYVRTSDIAFKLEDITS
jgi:hypothetical protein